MQGRISFDLFHFSDSFTKPLIAAANPYAMKTKKISNQWLPVFSAHLMTFLSSLAKQQNRQNAPVIKNPEIKGDGKLKVTEGLKL